MTKTPAIDGGIKLLSDLVKDVLAAMGSGMSLSARLAVFSNLIGDLMGELALLPNLKAEIAAAQPDDYGRFATEIATDAGLTSPHAILIVNAFIKLAGDGAIGDVVGLIHAIVNKPA